MNVLEREQLSLAKVLSEYDTSCQITPNEKAHGDHIQYNPFTCEYSILTYKDYKNMNFVEYCFRSILGLFTTPSDLASQILYTVCRGNFTKTIQSTGETEFYAINSLRERIIAARSKPRTWARYINTQLNGDDYAPENLQLAMLLACPSKSSSKVFKTLPEPSKISPHTIPPNYDEDAAWAPSG